MRLLESVRAKLPKPNKPQRLFILVLLELMLMVPGPITFRNLSRYSGFHEKSFARGFARTLDWVALNREAIAQVVPPAHEQALVLDASFIAKSGRQTYGLDRFWNGTAGRAEKGLEISALAWLDITAHQAYSLSVEQTPAAVKGSDNAAVADSRLDAYLAQLRRVVEGHQLQQQLKYVITDGYYSKVKFLNGVITLGLQQIGKLRGDADMRYLYDGPKRPGAGRQKQFDGQVDWSDLARFTRIETDQDGVVVYQQGLNHKRFKRTLNIVVVVDPRGKTPRQAILFSTDLTLPALTLFRYYRARFQIEFLFRDAKQFTGLSDCQARDKDKLHCHFNASLSAVTLAKLEAQQQAGGTLTEPFSMASLQRRAFNRHLLDQILAHLESSAELTKFSPAYETLCNYGTISPQVA